MDKGYLNFNADTTCDLYPLHFGIKQCAHYEPCGPMIRDQYLIHYVISGKGIFCDEQNEYLVKAGDFFAIYPDNVVSYIADESEPWFFCWIGFNGSKAEECYRKLGISRDSAVGKAGGKQLVNCVNECIDYANTCGGIPSQLRLNGFLYEALSVLENEKNRNYSSKEYANAAMLYMDCNCGERISVAAVANHIGFEYSYFYRLFKRETGITPEKYLINARIEKAKKLIKKGYSFKEIPSMTGIGNVYYFTKLFKKIVGITPSEYRKKSCFEELSE